MKRFIVACFLVVILFDLTAQVNKYGVPLIQNYPSELTMGVEQNWCMVQDVSGNMFFGTQDRGVLCYDGTKWNTVTIGNNPRIYSLATDNRGLIYVGGAFEFGFIQPSETGSSEYISLAERIDSIPEIRVIWSVEVVEEKVFFLSPRYIYIYNTEIDSLSEIALEQYGIKDAFRMLRFNDKLIITDNNEGIFELHDNSISRLKGGEFFRNKICTVLLPFSEDEILAGTYFDGIFLYNYSTGYTNSNFINRELNERLKAAIIYSGTLLNDDLFAIGATSREGALVFNRSGDLVFQLNKETCDLVDDAVHSMYCNHRENGEFWLATYGYLNKVYLNIPLTKYSDKQGIEYGINDIAEFEGHIYLSTDAGILKDYTGRDGHVGFIRVKGTEGQYFPLEVINSSHNKYLLTGYTNGLIQIFEDNSIRGVEKKCYNDPIDHNEQPYSVRKILHSGIDPDVIYLGDEVLGITILRDEGNHWHYVNRIKGFPGLVSDIIEKPEGGLWFMTDDPDALYSLTFSETDTSYTQYGLEKGVPDISLGTLHLIDKELYITTADGIIRYDKQGDTFVSDNSLTGGFTKGIRGQNMFYDLDGDLWYNGIEDKDFEILFKNTPSGITRYQGILNLLPSVPALDYLHYEGRVYITKSKILAVLEKDRLVPDTSRVNTHFKLIAVGSDSVIMETSFQSGIDSTRRIPVIYPSFTSVPEYGYDMNKIIFEWTTPWFLEELLTEYSYKLEGYDEDWSDWESISFDYTREALYPKKEYTNLPYGHYTFYVRCRTLTGQEGKELKYEFIILKPWYATVYAYIGYVLIAFLIVYGIIMAYTRRLKNENIRLEGIVRERTAVVVRQKEELESSIHYASRIQMAVLPSRSILMENTKNCFILFKPRDIVSGDFYWMTRKNDRLYIVAADCTGHGVPGAFMSLLGMSFLDEIIGKEDTPKADEMLNQLRLHVTDSLKQSGVDDEAKDGMDIAILVLDFKTNMIEYSGAYNPCFRVRRLNNEETLKYSGEPEDLPDGSMTNGKYLLETIYADKMPIGISSKMNEKFTLHEWGNKKDVSYYLFSDGYIDQFGGSGGRKFMKKNFKRLLLEIQDNPMDRQKELLDNNLIEWMGGSPQIDDILVLGIRT